MASLQSLLKDPNYVNANEATKAAIFDKYAPQDPNFSAANPATQAAIRAKFGVAAPRPQPTPIQRDWTDVGVEAVSNIPSSALNLAGGMYQAVRHPIKTAGGLLDIAAGGVQMGAEAMLPKQAVDFLEQFGDPAATTRAVKAAKAVGGFYADRYGSVEGLKKAIATDPVGVAGDLSVLLSGGATATAKVAPAVSRGLAKTAEIVNPVNVLAPAARTVSKVVQKVPGAVTSIAYPKSTAYLEAAEGRGPEIVNALLNPAREIVPGSKPTAAQAAAPTGVTRFQALGASTEKVMPTAYEARGAEQSAARLAAVRTVGQNEAALGAAKTARGGEAAQNYGGIENNVIQTDDTFRALLQKPSVNKAVERAKDLASEKGLPFQLSKDVLPSTVAGMRTAGRPAEYTVGSIHLLKLAMDDLLKDPAKFGIGANEAISIGNTQAKLVKWLESKEPGYEKARLTYAAQSKPINQMEVGQFLEGKLTSALSEEAPQRAGVFAGAVKEAPTTIKRATGQARYDRLAQILEPDQVKTILSIRDDLARAAESKRLAGKAGTIGPKATEVASMADQVLRLPNLLSRVTMVANDIRRRLLGKIDSKLAIEIATEMLDPNAAAAALNKAMSRERKAQGTKAAIDIYGKSAGNLMRKPGAIAAGQATNAMAGARERQNSMTIDPEAYGVAPAQIYTQPY